MVYICIYYKESNIQRKWPRKRNESGRSQGGSERTSIVERVDGQDRDGKAGTLTFIHGVPDLMERRVREDGQK